MNLSEQESEWPDNYEVEITEAHRTDGSFNETNNNGTLTFQGKWAWLKKILHDFVITTNFPTGNKIVVRPEEALIVIFVLILWMAAIGLFVHRWGKIRNCEPYAPKFEAEHRGSCHDQSNLINKRMSMSSKLANPGPMLTAQTYSFAKGLVSCLLHFLNFKVDCLTSYSLSNLQPISTEFSVCVSPSHDASATTSKDQIGDGLTLND